MYTEQRSKKRKRKERKTKQGEYEYVYLDGESYCVCGRAHVDGIPMIGCDICDQWFHQPCVRVAKQDTKAIQKYVCPFCSGPKGKNYVKRVKRCSTPCVNFETCKTNARTGSKYCSHNCGIEHALLLFKRKKQEEVEEEALLKRKERERQQSILKHICDNPSDGNDLHQIQDHALLMQLEEDEKDSNRELEEIALQREELRKAVARAENLPCSPANTGNKKRYSRAQGILYDCKTCGKPFQLHQYAQHLESCYLKKESHSHISGIAPSYSEDASHIVYCDYFDAKTKTYCKKLKASCPLHAGWARPSSVKSDTRVCSFPFQNGSYCKKARRDCLQHVNWECMLRQSLLLKEISAKQALQAIEYERCILCKRVADRLGLKTPAPPAKPGIKIAEISEM